MKTKNLIIAVLMAAIAILALALPVSAGNNNPNGLNARFMKWYEEEHVVHLWPGFEDDPTIYLEEGQPSLYGFEFEGTLEALQAMYEDPRHDLTLTILGDEFVPGTSIKSSYQEPFVASPGTGPAWSWDHDGDGLGDGNGNGIGDWEGPILFIRYPHPGFSSGTYNLFFTVWDNGVIVDWTHIRVIVP